MSKQNFEKMAPLYWKIVKVMTSKMIFPSPKSGQICKNVIEFDKFTLVYIDIVTKLNFFDSSKHFTIFFELECL